MSTAPSASSCDRCKPLTGILTRHSKTFLNNPTAQWLATAVYGRFCALPRRYRGGDTVRVVWRPAPNPAAGTPVAARACCSGYRPVHNAPLGAVAPTTRAPLRCPPDWPRSVQPPAVSTGRPRSRPDAASSHPTSRASPTCSIRLLYQSSYGAPHLARDVFYARRPHRWPGACYRTPPHGPRWPTGAAARPAGARYSQSALASSGATRRAAVPTSGGWESGPVQTAGAAIVEGVGHLARETPTRHRPYRDGE